MSGSPGHAWLWKGAISLVALLVAVPALAYAIASPGSVTPLAAGTFQATEAFTFLFLAIGPSHVIAGFANTTAGRDRRFKTRLALYGTLAAALAIAIAATIGVRFLQKWHLSIAALAFAAGLLLLLVALNQLLGHRKGGQTTQPAPDAPPPTALELAFSPLAVPIIIPPFGMAVVILLLALAQQHGAMSTMISLVVIMLVLDFLAMMATDLIVRISVLRYAVMLLQTMMSVLQVALAVQTIATAMRDLNVS